MKKILTTLALAITMSSAMAIPAKPGLWKNITLTDGTIVRVQLSGDEHAHFWQAADGKRYVENEEGVFTEVTTEKLQQRAQARRAAMKPSRLMSRPAKVEMGDRTEYKGKKKGIVILVQFSNVSFKSANNLAKYKCIMNEEGYSDGSFQGSVSDYFKTQSDGQFELEFDVVGPYTMPKMQSYYGNNDNGEDEHPDEMVVEACKKADAEVNFKDYDWDGDGAVDQVFVLYAGTGEADGGSASTIWPHMYYLSATNMAITLDGVTIDTYACSNEVTTDGAIEGIGCFCHEFSHCMGFPDFYDTSYSGWFGMGDFDLMCSGSYNGETFIPAGYTAHEKMMCGWQEPTVLGDQDVTVTNLKPMSEHGETFIIYNDGNANEYFMIENRQLTGWDKGYPTKGLMITHVDFDKNIWEYNCPNTKITKSSDEYYYGYPLNDHQRMTIVHADNEDDSRYWSSYGGYYTKTTETTDLYPYNSLDSLTATSTPMATLYNKNKKGTTTVEWAILNIKQNSDGTMSFKYRAPGSNSGGDNPTPDPQPTDDYIFYESFDMCKGTGGNDDNWETTVASSSFIADKDGWESDKAYGGNKCARFGARDIVGIATTPSFMVNGTATLTFKAAKWGSDGATLELYSDDATITPSSFTMPSEEWGEFIATISGTGTVNVTFSPSKRFFLDEVKVFENNTTGVETVKPAVQTIRIYTLDGRYIGSDENALPRGLYIINGKKVVK